MAWDDGLNVWQYRIHKRSYEEQERKRIAAMHPCLVTGCKKTDDQKPQCFKGLDYCSERHRKVLAGELKLFPGQLVPTIVMPVTNEKSVVE